MTSNLPFSEWTHVIPHAGLCKALIDRITDRAHIIETGAESYRFCKTPRKTKRPHFVGEHDIRTTAGDVKKRETIDTRISL